MVSSFYVWRFGVPPKRILAQSEDSAVADYRLNNDVQVNEIIFVVDIDAVSRFTFEARKEGE